MYIYYKNTFKNLKHACMQVSKNNDQLESKNMKLETTIRQMNDK